MTPRSALACCLVLCGGLFGQTPATAPQFATASIKLNLSASDDKSFDVSSGGLRVINTPLAAVFGFAFQLPDESFLQAPDWIMREHYDVIAQGPATSYEGVRQMTQALLTSRLKLDTHTEPRTLSAFVLTVAPGGAKLQKSAGTGKASCEPIGEQGMSTGGQHRGCTNMSMQTLARALSMKGMAAQYFDRPVIDQTDLPGTYDFRLDWVGKQHLNEVAGAQTIFDAVEKLGLKADQKEVTVPVLVIDYVAKPGGN
jgi:uncharacterized protein (TIGR03435 family)